jgi:hypothetical protein
MIFAGEKRKTDIQNRPIQLISKKKKFSEKRVY